MMRIKRIIIIASIILLFLIPFEGNCQEIRGFIDIGTHKLYHLTLGNGTPSIVIDVGFGESYQSWLEIARSISKYTRVVLYDRAGYGQSEP